MSSLNVWTLLLVAGRSERFGGIKALAKWREGTLISNAIGLAKQTSRDKVCAIVGGHTEPLLGVLGDVMHSVNPNWKQGMGSSISWGVQKILEMDSEVQFIVILPVDQPLVSRQHLEALLHRAKATRACVLSESLSKIHGPPAVLPRSFFEKATDLQGNKGLKAFLQDGDYETVFHPTALEDVDTVEDLARLRSLDASSVSKSTFVAAHATKLSLIEIILGSIVHGLKIPFGGNFLSLNQGLFLCRATQYFSHDRRAAAFIPLQVSSVSSVLKSLSPAGQKLGPMIAIGMQGFLYSICILIMGPSRPAQSVGMMLLSFWSFVQPILTLWLFYGESLSKAAFFFFEKLRGSVPAFADTIVYVLIALVVLKALVAASLPWLLSVFGGERFDLVTDRASEKAVKYMPAGERSQATSQWQAVKRTFRDLTRPAFLIPCLLVTAFLVFSETKNAQWIWKMLRPLAVATVFFYLTNTPWMRRLSLFFRERQYFPQFFSALDQTRDNLAKKKREALQMARIGKEWNS